MCSMSFQVTLPDWWLGTFLPYIGNVIIPTDELIFFRGVGQPPTSYPYCSRPDHPENLKIAGTNPSLASRLRSRCTRSIHRQLIGR